MGQPAKLPLCLTPLPSAGVTAAAPPRIVRHQVLTGAPVPVPPRLGTAARRQRV